MRNRMSRVGRKNLIRLYFARFDTKHKGGAVSTGTVAKWMGLKSSTYLKNILREMVEDGELIRVSFAPRRACGYTIDGWKYACYIQSEFPDRFIIINGESMRAL